ncbi:unnamed protein product, partial [marine sediment metagenome]
ELSCFNATDDNELYCMMVYATPTRTYVNRLNWSFSSIDACNIFGSNWVYSVAMKNTTRGYSTSLSPPKLAHFNLISGNCGVSTTQPISPDATYSIDLDQPLDLIYMGYDGEVRNSSGYFKFYSGTGDVERIALSDGTSAIIYLDDGDGNIKQFFGGNSSYNPYFDLEISDFEYKDRWQIIEDGEGFEWLVGSKLINPTTIRIARYNFSAIIEEYGGSYEANETEVTNIFGLNFEEIPAGIGALVGLDSDSSGLLFALLMSLIISVMVYTKIRGDSNVFLLTFIASFLIMWAMGFVPTYLIVLIGFITAVLLVYKLRA